MTIYLQRMISLFGTENMLFQKFIRKYNFLWQSSSTKGCTWIYMEISGNFSELEPCRTTSYSYCNLVWTWQVYGWSEETSVVIQAFSMFSSISITCIVFMSFTYEEFALFLLTVCQLTIFCVNPKSYGFSFHNYYP